MKNRTVRLVLVLLALAAVAGAGYFVFVLERRSAAARDAQRQLTEAVIRLQATIAELRAAQAGYLATGQDAAVWMAKVAELRRQADAQVKGLAAPSGDQRENELGTIAESLASFGRFDDRVHELLRDAQPLTASSLIFNDAAQLLATASGALARERGARAAHTGELVARFQRYELYAAGGACGVVLLSLVLLLPVARADAQASVDGESSATGESTRAAAGAEPQESAPAERASAGLDFDLELPPRARKASDAPASTRQTALRLESGTRRAQPDLAGAASLCTDLARVHETSELQGLLGRVASLLNASGIVLWMRATQDEALWPAFSHGYSPQALSRMKALPSDGPTPVSVAFRKGLLEVVPAGDRTGAIVAPILTAGGCVGVMAVELAQGADTSDAMQSMAGIVAAQLATLVAGETAESAQ